MATDWAVEITRIAGTGVIALTGAFLGFRFANQGRKHELLYKEQYTAFKTIAEYLLEYRDLVRRAALRLEGEAATVSLKDFEQVNVKEINELYSKIVEMRQRSSRIALHLLVLPEEARGPYLRFDAMSAMTLDNIGTVAYLDLLHPHERIEELKAPQMVPKTCWIKWNPRKSFWTPFSLA